MTNSSLRPSLVRGMSISEGIVFGELRFMREAKRDIQREKGTPEQEKERISYALSSALANTEKIYDIALVSAGEEQAAIFEIHKMLLSDEDFREEIEKNVSLSLSAEDALSLAVEKYVSIFEQMDDEYLSGRGADIRDIGERVLRILSGEDEAIFENERPYILVCRDLTPSETVRLDRSKILGFVTMQGSQNSHSAILARSMGIPALARVGSLSDEFDGAFAILDAVSGELIISPDEYQLSEYEKKKAQSDAALLREREYLESLIGKEARTRDGKRVLIYANVGGIDEIDSSLRLGAEGIGLFRSEFMYLSRKNYPTEDELFESYRSAAEKMGEKRTVIRTLDVGADKQIDYFGLEKEENPALGKRGIRLCFEREDVFKTQIRAILRASAYGKLAIMLPMIVSEDEVRRSLAIIAQCKRELRARGQDFDGQIEFGIMIETPAAAIMSDAIAPYVDFFSVGTNDLLQYTLAADRQNPELCELCDKNHEPVLRLLAHATRCIHKSGGWIGICGELAGDLSLTARFVDMGVDELSVSSSQLLALRGKVMSL